MREYRRLLDKSSDAFQTLRDLPSYGKSHWDPLFHQVRSPNRSRSSDSLRRLRCPSPSRVRSRPARRSPLDALEFAASRQKKVLTRSTSPALVSPSLVRRRSGRSLGCGSSNRTTAMP